MPSPNPPLIDTKADHQAAILAKKTNPSTCQPVDIDPAIIAGHSFIQATALGGSLWCQAAKIETAFSPSTTTKNSNDGSSNPIEPNFFLKTAHGPIGRKMFTGEFAGMMALHEALPEFAPKPIAFGTCSSVNTDSMSTEGKKEPSSSYFFLKSYIPMSPSHPLNSRDFCSQLATLHKSTAVTSPNGKFGVGTTTCNRNIEQLVDWEERRDIFFAKGLRWMVDLHSRLTTSTKNDDLQKAVDNLCQVVIPHLLFPSQLKDGITGQPIKPCLVHGDLWMGNTGTDTSTKTPVVYDPAAFYAHNEYELGNWVPGRCGFGGLDGEYVREYRRCYPPAEPRGEWEDRVRLYAFRFELHFRCLFPGQEEPKRVLKVE